jgi:tetratricopeptide (TPR) repeat protein
MKRALKWLGIGVLSLFVLSVVIGILFGEAEEQPAASVSTPASEPTPTSAPTQASEEHAAWLKHGLAGEDYFYEGKYLLALTEFKMQQEVSSDPGFLGQSLYWIGKTHYELGSYSAAVDSYSKALALEEPKKECPVLSRDSGCRSPGIMHDNHLRRGIAYRALGQFDRALSDFNASLEQIETGEAYFERATYWTMTGESDKAVQDLVDARKLSPYLFK